MKKRVLLTGAAGAIGRETMAELVRRSDRYDVRAIELPRRAARARLRQYEDRAHIIWGDIRCDRDVEAALDGVDVILHLAAVIPPLADRDPQYAETVNVGGTKKLLDAARRSSKPVRFIYTSSISVYGDRLASPWIEVGDPLRPSPHDRYAVTKIRAEELVQRSGLAWSIFRLTGVLRPDMGLDPLMFHMPLETSLEIVTCRDCGYAVVQAIEVEAVDGRVFNLGGGPRCRTTYRECLENVFSRVGLGARLFPDEAFAGGNFHCGFYRDSDELESLLGFQREGLEELYEQVAHHLPPAARTAAAASRPLVRWFLLRQSDPWIARQRKDHSMLERFRCLSGTR